jgi:RNA polymerase sigma factor (TIGR02999 family)
MTTSHDITLLLHKIDDGEAGAMDELMRVVYADLERMAASYLREHFGDRMGQLTLEPAALVNESFLRLIKQRNRFDNRGQFFAIATKIMLRVLIDYQRQKLAAKRGGSAGLGDSYLTLMLDDRIIADPRTRSAAVQVEDLESALDKLDALDSRKADIVKMRVVWGMTVPEVAEALAVSPSSVDRDWKFAKAWIADEVGLTER